MNPVRVKEFVVSVLGIITQIMKYRPVFSLMKLREPLIVQENILYQYIKTDESN